MKLISFEQLDVALDLMPSNSFTTQDFIDVFEKVCPLEYSQVVAAYGVGGKNSGSHYSAKAHIGKSLSNYKGWKSLRFVSYIHAHPEWGNPVIALWSLLSADDVLEADLLQEIEQEGVGNTERVQSILARVGQGKFRQGLINKWGACQVTGCEMIDILVASHIKPWSLSQPSERLDVNNGLLLVPNIDKLFDKGYITFLSDGLMQVSDAVGDSVMNLLGVSDNVRINLPEESQEYMKFHREHVFVNKAEPATAPLGGVSPV